MDETGYFRALSLYERLGLMDFSSSELIRLRVEDLEKRHGDNFSRNLSKASRDQLILAIKILQIPESKQRYDTLLRAVVGNDPVIPRFPDEEVAKQTTSLAELVGIQLEKIAELTFQVQREAKPPTKQPEKHKSRATIGVQEIEFQSIPFAVETALIGQPISICLFTDPPQFIPFNFQNTNLYLRPGHEGSMIAVSVEWQGRSVLFAACANHTTHGSTYIEQAAGELFDGSLIEIANRFNIRAKKSRVLKLIENFHDELVTFASECSGDFKGGVNKEKLTRHLERHSYFYS